MFACSKYCVFFIFSFMRVLINANQTRRQISETEGTDLCVFYLLRPHAFALKRNN